MSEIKSDDILIQILLNQRQILLGLSIIITPMCRTSTFDANGETKCNIGLIERYHKTEQLLNKIEKLPSVGSRRQS